MGKTLPSSGRLQNFARIITSDRINPPKQAKPTSKNQFSNPEKYPQPKLEAVSVDPARLGLKLDNSARVPLAHVVSDCVKRWFRNTLKEAKAGDIGMQILVGQMYNSGYGVRRDTNKGRTWFSIALKGRSSAWKVSNKQPGYDASDSDSDDLKEVQS